MSDHSSCAIESLEARQFLSAAKLGSISGSVFADVNLNGAHGAGEPGVKSAYVFLDLNGNGLYDKKTEPAAKTDKRGAFAFAGLKAGTYRLRELVSQSSTSKAFATTAVSAPASGYFKIKLAAGQNIIHRQFGNVTVVAPISTTTTPTSFPQSGSTIGSASGIVSLTGAASTMTSMQPPNSAAQDVSLLIRSARTGGNWTTDTSCGLLVKFT